MKPPLWTCPICGRAFTRASHSHACGRFSVEAFLRGHDPRAMALFRRFEAAALAGEGCVAAPAKTRVGFQNLRIFASVNRVGKSSLDVHLVTSEPLRSSRIRRVEKLAPGCFVNHLTIRSEEETDAELKGWLEAARRWGESA